MNSMASRSCLELMLEKIQQVEDDQHQPKDINPPPLPLRARLPQRRNISQPNKLFHHHFHKAPAIDVLETAKGASNIQKWYRGHREGVIALQSFVRAENARRGYLNCLRAIILIQKQTRNYLEYRLVKRQHTASGHNPNSRENTDTNFKEETRIWVGYSALIDLQKRVLRTEAKVREKKEENITLKMRLEEMEEKWQQYEERMKSMEKAWQDEFTYIQEYLSAGKKINDPGDANTISRMNPHGRSLNLDFPINDILVYEDSNRYYSHKILNPHEELSKLKLRFKAWKKEYKSKLREAQWMFKKLGITSETATVKSQKYWWGRLSN